MAETKAHASLIRLALPAETFEAHSKTWRLASVISVGHICCQSEEQAEGVCVCVCESPEERVECRWHWLLFWLLLVLLLLLVHSAMLCALCFPAGECPQGGACRPGV